MILSFKKPKRAKSIDAWKNDYSADGAPPGVYEPNMSQEDRLKWKAKVVGHKTENFQVEIRSTEPGANTVIIVNGKMPNQDPDAVLIVRRSMTPHKVRISANGPMNFEPSVWHHFQEAVSEAYGVLVLLDNPATRKDTVKRIRAGEHPLEA